MRDGSKHAHYLHSYEQALLRRTGPADRGGCWTATKPGCRLLRAAQWTSTRIEMRNFGQLARRWAALELIWGEGCQRGAAPVRPARLASCHSRTWCV